MYTRDKSKPIDDVLFTTKLDFFKNMEAYWSRESHGESSKLSILFLIYCFWQTILFPRKLKILGNKYAIVTIINPYLQV